MLAKGVSLPGLATDKLAGRVRLVLSCGATCLPGRQEFDLCELFQDS